MNDFKRYYLDNFNFDFWARPMGKTKEFVKEVVPEHLVSKITAIIYKDMREFTKSFIDKGYIPPGIYPKYLVVKRAKELAADFEKDYPHP